MNRSLQNITRRLALAPALLLVAGQLPANAAPPSPIVVEHLIAQAGLSVGFGWNSAAQFFTVLTGASSIDCNPAFGGTNSSTLGTDKVNPSTQAAVVSIYYDNACQKPYFTDDFQVPVASTGFYIVTQTGEFIAPNGAILGVLSQAQQLAGTSPSVFLSGKGTNKAVAGLGQPPVRTGLACHIFIGSPFTYTCQEGVAQDFPALKRSLGTVARLYG